MNATIYQVLEALQTKAGTSFVGGYSGLDMTGRVVIGALLEPPTVPYASVSFTDYTTERGANLASYRMTGRFDVYCFAAGSSVTERTKNIVNLTSDIVKEITSDRFLGLTNDDGTRMIDDVICNFTTVEGDKYGLDGMAIGYIEVTVPFQSRTGV